MDPQVAKPREIRWQGDGMVDPSREAWDVLQVAKPRETRW